jgi:hypothetical protein
MRKLFQWEGSNCGKHKVMFLYNVQSSNNDDTLFQVSEVNVNLNPKKGERAVLIKNNEGDWGIVIGCWRDFKRGIKGKLSTNCII